MSRKPNRNWAATARFEATKARRAMRSAPAPAPPDPGTEPTNRAARRRAARPQKGMKDMGTWKDEHRKHLAELRESGRRVGRAAHLVDADPEAGWLSVVQREAAAEELAALVGPAALREHRQRGQEERAREYVAGVLRGVHEAQERRRQMHIRRLRFEAILCGAL